MATSSITKDFLILGDAQVEKFTCAIEASINDRKPLKILNAVYVTDPDVIAECMARRKKLHAVRIWVFNIE